MPHRSFHAQPLHHGPTYAPPPHHGPAYARPPHHGPAYRPAAAPTWQTPWVSTSTSVQPFGWGGFQPQTSGEGMDKLKAWLDKPTVASYPSVKNKHVAIVVGVSAVAGLAWYGSKHRWF